MQLRMHSNPQTNTNDGDGTSNAPNDQHHIASILLDSMTQFVQHYEGGKNVENMNNAK